MTDPLSIVVSTLTLTSAVRYGAGKVRSLYTAPAEIDRIKAEVDSLETLLEAVQTFAQANPDGPTGDLLTPSLDVAKARIGSLHGILTSPAFGIKSLSNANRARSTYVRYRRRLATLEQELRESVQKISINLMLATA